MHLNIVVSFSTIGLIFSGYESPLIATDMLQKEEGHHQLNGIPAGAAEPFGVEDGAIIPLELFNNQDVLFLYSTSVLNNSETIK